LNPRRQDSKFKIQDLKKMLESKEAGFKIQGSRSQKKKEPNDAGFKIQDLKKTF
jgi:hypothetical protein